MTAASPEELREIRKLLDTFDTSHPSSEARARSILARPREAHDDTRSRTQPCSITRRPSDSAGRCCTSCGRGRPSPLLLVVALWAAAPPSAAGAVRGLLRRAGGDGPAAPRRRSCVRLRRSRVAVTVPRAARPGGAVYLGPAANAGGTARCSARVAIAADARRPTLPLVSWLAGAWAAGVIALAFWHAGGWVHLRRGSAARRGRSRGELREVLDELAGGAAASRRPVRLVEAAWVQVPAVVGALRPVLLFPAAALTGLTPGQLRRCWRTSWRTSAGTTTPSTCSRRWSRRCCSTTRRCGGCRRGCGRSGSTAATTSPPPRAATGSRTRGRWRRWKSCGRCRWGWRWPRAAGRCCGACSGCSGVAPAPGATRGRNRSLVAAALAVACAALPLAAPRLGAGPAADAPTTRPAHAGRRSPPPTGPAEDGGDAGGPGGRGEGLRDPAQRPCVHRDRRPPGARQGDREDHPREPGRHDQPAVRRADQGRRPDRGRRREGDRQDVPGARHPGRRRRSSVAVVEARGRSFSIIGDAGRPGQYAIAAARLPPARRHGRRRGGPEGGRACSCCGRSRTRPARPGEPPPQPRKIRVPMEKLAAGDMGANLVIRPGDLIVVEGGWRRRRGWWSAPTASPSRARP